MYRAVHARTTPETITRHNSLPRIFTFILFLRCHYFGFSSRPDATIMSETMVRIIENKLWYKVYCIVVYIPLKVLLRFP